jgi:pilus assembly protein CpaB
VLPPAARAISVGVDAITGNGGLISPGDRVDVILTQALAETDTTPARRLVAETVLSDVRVVAVDQSITEGGVATGDNAIGRLARTVTLEVTPQQAAIAVVALQLGKITLAIRAADAPDAPFHQAAVYGGDVSAALADAAPRMHVIEGKDDREVIFQRPPAPAAPTATPQGSDNARLQPL